MSTEHSLHRDIFDSATDLVKFLEAAFAVHISGKLLFLRFLLLQCLNLR
jgi:hypothetical protein